MEFKGGYKKKDFPKATLGAERIAQEKEMNFRNS